MDSIWNLEFQLFVLIAVGFLTRRIGMIGNTGEKSLTDLVLYVVLPCNIFVSFLNQNASENAGDMAAVVLVSVGIQTASLVYGKLAFPKENEDRRRNLAYGMICSNAGFLGSPIAEGVFGVLGLSRLVTGVSTLLAAMPAGATTTMLAAKYERDPQFATKLVVFTTLLSIPAILIWSLVLTA